MTVSKLKLRAKLFWLWKLMILYRNQKRFLHRPIYKHLKGIFVYTRKQTIEENQQHVGSFFFQSKPV